MRVTYFALKPLLVGEDTRQPGDLVPEAGEWPYLTGYIQDGAIQPVLVATLPEEQQLMLLDWEEEQEKAALAAQDASEAAAEEATVTPDEEPDEAEDDEDSTEDEESEVDNEKAVAVNG